MPASNGMMLLFEISGFMLGWMAARYPGRIGRIYSPARWVYPPPIPFAIDNGAYAAYANNRKWDEAKFMRLLENIRCTGRKPLWIAVPDVVEDAQATLESWHLWKDRLRPFGPLAFVAQDGMTTSDVPKDADTVFIGGSTSWKWQNAEAFCRKYPTHIGRVNSREKLEIAERIGCKSIDGSGWLRDRINFSMLEAYLSSEKHPELDLSKTIEQKPG